MMDLAGVIMFAVIILLVLAAVVLPQIWPSQSQAYQGNDNEE